MNVLTRLELEITTETTPCGDNWDSLDLQTQLNDHLKIEKDLVSYPFKLKYKRFIRITSWKLQVDLKAYTNFETSGKDTRKKNRCQIFIYEI